MTVCYENNRIILHIPFLLYLKFTCHFYRRLAVIALNENASKKAFPIPIIPGVGNIKNLTMLLRYPSAFLKESNSRTRLSTFPHCL